MFVSPVKCGGEMLYTNMHALNEYEELQDYTSPRENLLQE
jgi:hypothetical protein